LTDEDRYDVIFADMVSSVGGGVLLCPPPSFVTPRALKLLHASLRPGRGVLAVNLVTQRGDADASNLLKKAVLRFLAIIFLSRYITFVQKNYSLYFMSRLMIT
jgi:hypothetical protein